MERGHPFIRLKLDTSEPVELDEFVGAFTALAAEYERFVKEARPDVDPRATLYVREVRAGCIEADLIPLLTGMAGSAMIVMQSANTLGEFVERYGQLLQLYIPSGGKAPDATVTQLRDFTDQVAAIASTPKSSLEIAALEIKDGEKEVRAAFVFDTNQAREIRDHASEHRRELEATTDATHKRVLMIFRRSDADAAKINKRSGELVRVDELSPRKLPLIYASDLAERQIKHEIAEADDSVYKKGFVVDVNVEMRAGRPIAYRVMHLHQVIDLPDDDDPESEQG